MSDKDKQLSHCPKCHNEDLDYQRRAVIDVDKDGRPILEEEGVIFLEKKIQVSCHECGMFYRVDIS